MRRRTTAVVVLVAVAGMVAASGAAIATEPRAETHLVAVDRAREAGLARFTKSWSASVVDSNHDGSQDVWIGYHGTGAKLWQNKGNGRYDRVARNAWPADNAAGRTIDRHDCVWVDVDRDGRMDAYCSTGRFLNNVVKRDRDNELWLQKRRGHFREVGTSWGVGDVCGRGRHIAFLDANGDRWPDLFLGNETPRRVRDECNRRPTSPYNEQSKLFLNTHGTGFRKAPGFWNHGAGPGTQCAEVLDFNDDGWDDLLTCRENDRTPRLYANAEGHGFDDVTAEHQLGSTLTDAVVADLDGDGDPDLITAGRDRFAYHLNVDQQFRTATSIGTPPAGVAGSVAVGDADGDGDLDVYGMVGKGYKENPDDLIWLQEGPLGFTTQVPVPPVGGAANEVVALDRRGTGRASFLVLNGFGRATGGGPIQLIQLVRR